jgi:hypothetical protein
VKGSIIAAVSYWFYRLARAEMQWLVRRHYKLLLSNGARQKWKTISEDLEMPGRLHVISVLAPRWNCHALLASMSPIWVGQSMTLELAGFGSQADAWSLILYDDSLNVREWIGSATIKERTVTWHLNPAAYTLSLRYYVDGDDIEVPTVIIDGSVRIVGGKIAGERLRYKRHLETIRNRDGLYFRLLHYYMFYYLSRQRKSEGWLRQQFLPVGNPDTEWHYGHLDVGEMLTIHCDEACQQTYNVYACFYNWASFPVEWQTIRTLEWCSGPFEQAVGYAIRRVERGNSDSLRRSELTFEAFKGTKPIVAAHPEASRL